MKNISLIISCLLFGLYATAQTFAIDSMKRILRATSSTDTNKVSILLKLSDEWLKINTDSSISYSGRAYTLASSLNYTNGMALARLAQAKTYVNTGDFAKAYEYDLEALHKYTKLQDSEGIATVYTSLGNLYELQEDYTKSIRYYTQALNEYGKIANKKGSANSLLRIGNIYYISKENNKALENFQKALNETNLLTDRKLATDIFYCMGLVNIEMQDYKKALNNSVRAKNLALINGSILSVADAYLNIGKAFMELKNYDSAMTSFELSLSYFRQLNKKENIAKSYDGLAELYTRLKKFDKAKQMIDLSNQFAYQVNNQSIIFDNFTTLAEISKAEGDYKSANNYYIKLLQLKDSLYDADKIHSIEKVKAGYELEKKQETIEELKIENLVKTKQRNTLIIAFSLVAISLLLLGFGVFQIKGKNKQLLSQKKELEDLHVVKDKFFSILSHDLRSPMVNILGLLNLISWDDTLSEEDKKEMFESLRSSTTNTLETMDNMLAWGKLQLKDNTHEIEVVNVQEVADRVCRFLQPNAENKSIVINNQINSDIHIMSDNNRLEFVLRNLMSNALKFSHHNSTVELWTTSDEAYINIHVKDYGTGMKKEVQDKLFDKKLESLNGTAGEIGTGLGLMLSKEFIGLNKGALLVNSEPGHGTTFIIRHPWSLS